VVGIAIDATSGAMNDLVPNPVAVTLNRVEAKAASTAVPTDKPPS
jgi:hypothetical protein